MINDYLSYWSLCRRPFISDDEKLFFAGVPQREVIAGLNYFVSSPFQFAQLVAAPGCGLTWLLKHVASMHGFGDSATEVVFTEGTSSHRDAVLAQLGRALGCVATSGRVADHVGRAIESSRQQEVKTIWLIDRSNAAAVSTARQLIADHGSLCVVAATALGRLVGASADGAWFPQIDLMPLTLEDTFDYVEYCLKQVGRERMLFSDSAAIRLHELSGGAIAEMAILAESSLATAANHHLDEVDVASVEAVDQQLRRAA